MAFTAVDKNLLIASLESALIYAQNTVGVSSLEELTTQIAALRSAFDADAENVTESMLESMIAKLQALEIPDPEKLSRLLTTTAVSDTNTYLAVCSWATILNKPATFPPDDHGHAWSEITYKPISYPPSEHTHPGLTTDWNALTSKPDTFPPSAHTHITADVTDLPETFPPTAHTHITADVSDFPATIPPAAHQHVKADVSDFPATLPGRMERISYAGNDAATRVISFSGAFVPRYALIDTITYGPLRLAVEGFCILSIGSSTVTIDATVNSSIYTYRMILLG